MDATLREETLEAILKEHNREAQQIYNQIINEVNLDQQESWMKTRMSHSQRFALEEEKAKVRPAEQIIPKAFHHFLPTVFLE